MIKSQKNFFTGLLFTLVGLFFFITGSTLGYGTPADMGPGFLPLTVSTMLIAIGLTQLVRGIKVTGEQVAFAVVKPAIILVTIAVFGFLLGKIGVILSALLLMLATAFLHKNFTLKNFCLSYLFVVGLILVFKFALRSPLPLWIS